jgi:hypothetical protein
MTYLETQLAIAGQAFAKGKWITVKESHGGDAGQYAGPFADPDGDTGKVWLVFTGDAAEQITVGDPTAGPVLKVDVWPAEPWQAAEMLAAWKADSAATLPVRGEGDKCACGNDTSDQGFGYALIDGTEIEDPTHESGWDGVYKCHVCGALSTLADN